MNPQNEEKNYIVSAADVKALLRAHDGDCALLWLWGVSTGRDDPESAALDLCMTAGQVSAAREKLSRMLGSSSSPREARSAAPAGPERPAAAVNGAQVPSPSDGQSGRPAAPQGSAFAQGQTGALAAPDQAPKVLRPADELPEYTSEDITSCARSDNGFSAVLQEAEQVLGKQLSRHDMSRLLGIYNHLGLPADVIFILLHYCEDSSGGPDGAERRPTMNFIERQAFSWVNHGIATAEAAEAFAEREKSVREDLGRIRRVLEIYDRNLTGNERASIESWLSAGLSDEVIRKAYEITVERTGKRSMAYMNKILLTWAEAGVKTVSDIEAKTGRKGPYGQKGSPAGHGEPALKPTEF